MEHTYGIGQRVRVNDEQRDDCGATGAVIARDDAGRYYVRLDQDDAPPEGHPFAEEQLTPNDGDSRS
jgi:hypothetical protein